jgi:hypothetical protein
VLAHQRGFAAADRKAFVALAWLARQRPRVAGVLLIAACIGFTQLFEFFTNTHLGLVTRGITFLLFIGPLLASGVALLAMRREHNDLEEDAAKLSRSESTRR